MTEPDEFEEHPAAEQLEPDERDVEAPLADAYEQAIPTDEEPAVAEVHRGLEVSEYDALEQAHEVPLDDDYRES